jgi:hypothetical protein
VYADWLDEHGDPARAEFIRIQCEMAPLGKIKRIDADGHARYVKLFERQNALLREHGNRWTFNLFGLSGFLRIQFHRGFVENLECSPCSFCSPEFSHLHSAMRRLLRCHPIRKLRWVSPALTSEGCRQLVRCEELALIRELRCHYDPGRNDPESFGQLLSSPNLASLEVLDLRNSYFGTLEGVEEALAASPLLERLTRLDLGNNVVSPKTLATILESAHFGISELGLCGKFNLGDTMSDTESWTTPCVGPSGVLVLARSPAVSRLRCLELAYNRLDVPAIEALLKSPHLDGVACLALGEADSAAFDAHKAALQTRFGARLKMDWNPVS